MLTALAEETADVAYIQQLVICMRLVDDQLTTQEEILFYSGPSAGTLVKCWVSFQILKLLGKCANK